MFERELVVRKFLFIIGYLRQESKRIYLFYLCTLSYGVEQFSARTDVIDADVSSIRFYSLYLNAYGIAYVNNCFTCAED